MNIRHSEIKMSIKNKLLLFLLSFILIPTWVMAILSFENAKKFLLKTKITHLECIADLKVDKIGSFFDERIGDIKAAQSFYNIRKNLPIVSKFASDRKNPKYLSAKKMLDDQLKVFQKMSGYVDVMLVGPAGKVVYASNKDHQICCLGEKLYDPQGRAFIEGRKAVYLSCVYPSRFKGYKYGMLITAPAYGFNGKLIGVIAFEVDMDPIYRFIQDTTGLGKTGETLIAVKEESNERKKISEYVSQRKGDYALVLNPLRFDPGAALKREIFFGEKDGVPIQRAVSGEEGSGRVRDYTGKEVLAVWRYIPKLKWGLVSKIDTAEAFEFIGRLRIIVITIAVIMMLAGAAAILLITKSIVDPIRRLHRGTEVIAEGNLDYKVGTDVKDEIGQLSRAFDRMCEKLKKTMLFSSELENIILERTAELREANRKLEDDIAQRKKIEEGLRKSEKRFRTLIEAAPDAIVIVNNEGHILQVNSQTEKLLGYRRDELAGKPHDMIVPARFREEHAKCMKDYFLKPGRRKMGSGLELYAVHKNGTEIPVDVSLSYFETDEGIVAVSIIHDITERKKTEKLLRSYNEELEKDVKDRTMELEAARAAAESANRAKSDFLANMSHELRTPLNAVIGFSEILRDEHFGPLNAKQKEYVSDVLESGKHLLSLINDVLDLTKVEAGKMELEFGQFFFADVVNSAMLMFNEKALKRGIVLTKDFDKDADIEITADMRKIKQVLYNLLSNAVKFTPDGGKVSLKAGLVRGGDREERDFLEVSVTDTGVGIKSEDIPKLFGEFVQLESPIGRRVEGTGLGLALSRRLVELHGGKIRAESEGVGKGSKFTFTIPVKQV